MSSNVLYVFYGHAGAEYVMTPLFAYMRDKGYDCIEITQNTCKDKREALYNISHRDTVLVSSAHMVYTETSPITVTRSSDAPPLLEAMDILRPVSNVYYPHDLAYLMCHIDMPWMASVFDLLLFPFDGFAHMGYLGADVHNTGWIKKHSKTSGGERFRVGHALGIADWFLYHGGGAEGCIAHFAPIWNQGVTVKVHENYEAQYSPALSQHGIPEFNAKDTIYGLIDESEIMLSDHTSSVHYESALSGRFTINILEGISSVEEHEKSLRGLPNLQIKTIDETAELLRAYFKGDFTPTQGEDIMKPFDFELAVKLITKR